MWSTIIVQLGGVTPTVPKLGGSARFFIPGIPGLDASFLSMKRLRSWTARFCTARGREDRGSAGWNCRRGCLIGPGVCQCGSHAIRMLHLRHWRSSSSCSPKRRAATASHCHQILRFRAQQVRLATRTGGMLMRHQSQPHAPAARSIRPAGPGGLRSAGPVMARAAGRDTSGGDRDAGTAPARSRSFRSLSDSDGGGQ